MTMRSDAQKNCETWLDDDSKPICGTRVPVTNAHWAEAKANVGDDKEDQRKWLRNEAVAGCKTGCKCAQSVAGDFDETTNVVSAECRKSANDVQKHGHSIEIS